MTDSPWATGGNGASFSAEHWTARQQGYVHCQRNPGFIPSVQQSPGWQPDPLLRLDVPDSGTELPSTQTGLYPNWRRSGVGVIPHIPANHSQSIWLTVCVPHNATPGIFEGQFTVDGMLELDGNCPAAFPYKIAADAPQNSQYGLCCESVASFPYLLY